MSSILSIQDINKIAELLNSDAIGVMPTDTIYGLHCKALSKDLTDKIYEIKKRPASSPCITLISSIKDLDMFNLRIGEYEEFLISKYWPGPNTLIFNTTKGASQSFRLPNKEYLLKVLGLTGPLVSTSANVHKKPYAKSIKEAQDYFGEKVDFYVDAGYIEGRASNVYKVENGTLIKIR